MCPFFDRKFAMSRLLGALLAIITIPLCSWGQQSDTDQKATSLLPPERLVDVKHGMSKDTVLSGLGKNYGVKTDGNMVWVSPGRGESEDGGGVIVFKDGVVESVVEESLPAYGTDAAALAKQIFVLLWAHTENTDNDITEPGLSKFFTKKHLSVELTVLDTHPLMEDQSIQVTCSDGFHFNIQINKRKGRDPTVTIERVR